MYVGQGACLSQEHNQILQVVTGWEAEDSWADPAFPSLLSQPPSSRVQLPRHQLLETQWAASSLLPNLRMPVGCTPLDRTGQSRSRPLCGLHGLPASGHLLLSASSDPVSCQALCSVHTVLRPRPDTLGLGGTLSYGGQTLWGYWGGHSRAGPLRILPLRNTCDCCSGTQLLCAQHMLEASHASCVVISSQRGAHMPRTPFSKKYQPFGKGGLLQTVPGTGSSVTKLTPPASSVEQLRNFIPYWKNDTCF